MASSHQAGVGDPTDDPMFIAAVDMIRRTGARGLQFRYSDDERPVVWLAVAEYERPGDPRSGNPAKRGSHSAWETAAALNPIMTVLRLCERVIDGGRCAHCHRPTGFSEDIDTMPADDLVCWFQWDPELKTFRRGCEGS